MIALIRGGFSFQLREGSVGGICLIVVESLPFLSAWTTARSFEHSIIYDTMTSFSTFLKSYRNLARVLSSNSPLKSFHSDFNIKGTIRIPN
jgi:hypothetical protein